MHKKQDLKIMDFKAIRVKIQMNTSWLRIENEYKETSCMRELEEKFMTHCETFPLWSSCDPV